MTGRVFVEAPLWCGRPACTGFVEAAPSPLCVCRGLRPSRDPIGCRGRAPHRKNLLDKLWAYAHNTLSDGKRKSHYVAPAMLSPDRPGTAVRGVQACRHSLAAPGRSRADIGRVRGVTFGGSQWPLPRTSRGIHECVAPDVWPHHRQRAVENRPGTDLGQSTKN